MSIEGKVALVTGASRGLGKAIALHLARSGVIVAGSATTESGAEAITTYMAEAGVKGKGFALDVCDADAIPAVIKMITEEFGVPLILVNNAGITRDNLMLRMKADEWDSVIDTNLSSLYRTTKACIRGMTKARWGRIINVGSVVGAMGNTGQANYAAAKAGMEGFGRSLAREFGSRDITVNTIAPGFIDTDMTKELPEAQKEAMLAQIPLRRLGHPDEIAAVVGFLSGDSAAYITGATIPVNGGMYM